jgi:hypothetical protein
MATTTMTLQEKISILEQKLNTELEVVECDGDMEV